MNSTLYTCHSGVGIGEVCPTQDVCGAGPAGVGCYAMLPNCSPDGVACAGDVGTLCARGSQVVYHCDAVGLSCQVAGGDVACLAPHCTQADVAACTESCSGATANVCVGGARVPIDCTKYGGFTKCKQLPANGFINTPYVECAP
jgi:hypothetical protein